MIPLQLMYVISKIIYIMGVSGSGKTTIGKKLSQSTGIPFFDGDDFHSEANKEKMRAGHPLTDEDRAGWLTRINELAKEQMKKNGAIIACSALKEKYRTILSAGITVPLYWVFLQGSYAAIEKRMEERRGHYMKSKMLASQFETLEIPANAITIDISKSPDEIVDLIVSKTRVKSS
ncbi:MAG TPA: gluconokinase [Chitinophagaceae bacterium]